MNIIQQNEPLPFDNRIDGAGLDFSNIDSRPVKLVPADDEMVPASALQDSSEVSFGFEGWDQAPILPKELNPHAKDKSVESILQTRTHFLDASLKEQLQILGSMPLERIEDLVDSLKELYTRRFVRYNRFNFDGAKMAEKLNTINHAINTCVGHIRNRA